MWISEEVGIEGDICVSDEGKRKSSEVERGKHYEGRTNCEVAWRENE